MKFAQNLFLMSFSNVSIEAISDLRLPVYQIPRHPIDIGLKTKHAIESIRIVDLIRK